MKSKSAWDSLTNTQKKALEKEYKELQDWYEQQRENREKELKTEGKWIEYGLDANQKKFSDVIAERKRRFAALQKKYGFRE